MHFPDEPIGTPPVDAVDPAIQAAGAAPADTAPATAAIDPLHKPRDAQASTDASVANHALFEQALERLEQLGTRRFKDRRELERIALAIAVQASAVGLSRVDRVALSHDGAGYFFADSQAVDPALRGYVAHAEAVKPDAVARAAQTQRQGQQQEEQAIRDADLRAQQERAARERASRDTATEQRAARDGDSRTEASQARAARDRAEADRAALDRASSNRSSFDRASDRASQERASSDVPPRRV